ncbi:MAG: methanogenesis marker 8 protein [Candidatus Methanosuratincola sp.]
MPEKDEHVLEAVGRSRVLVREGRVIEVGPPMIRECPLAKKFSTPVDVITPEKVRKNIESRITSYGMCTENRLLESSEDFVTFGASEMISQGIRSKILDVAVIVCEGAGTVITSNPDLVQGIGGRMSGLVSTLPIPGLIERIESIGGVVLDRFNARIDQVAGVELAYKQGYSNVAVTITDPTDGERIRAKYPDVLIFGVHLTGIGKDEAYRMAEVADLASGCASKWIREAAATHALLQAGSAVPVFAFTEKGKCLVLEKVRASRQRFLVKVEKIPYDADKCPEPLV